GRTSRWKSEGCARGAPYVRQRIAPCRCWAPRCLVVSVSGAIRRQLWPRVATLPYGRRSPLRPPVSLRLRGLLGWRSADTRTLLVHDTRLVAARVVHGTRLPGSAAGPRRAAHMTVPPHAGRRTTAQGCAATVSAGARCRRASRQWRGRAAR